tara:strand:+ start:324 stop:545 length:222 start_codon:yes stop_codon:yes gene_type:complete
MKTELHQLSEIPQLLYFSKRLISSRHIPKLQARKLARECRIFADKFPDSTINKEQALESVKQFSHWLHEFLEQ